MTTIRWGFVAAALVASGVARGDTAFADGERRVVFDGRSADGAQSLRLTDAQGRVVRELDLGDFLPEAYVRALPRKDGELQWWREAKLDRASHQVEFSVPAPSSTPGATGAALRFSIDLRDGAVRTAQIREYLAAADQARLLAAKPDPAGDPKRATARLAAESLSLPSTQVSR
jgi:hypothetical protein